MQRNLSHIEKLFVLTNMDVCKFLNEITELDLMSAS